MQDIIQLIDEDLDNVAGGDFNISDIDIHQSIRQFQDIDAWRSDVDASQSAANLAQVSVSQEN
jgi:hypothetical protein